MTGGYGVFSKTEALNYYDENADEFLFFPSAEPCVLSPSINKRRYTLTSRTILRIAKTSPKDLKKLSFKKDLFSPPPYRT